MGKKSVKPAGNKNTREWTAPIWVAVITGVVSLLLAIFAFPPFQKLFDPKPTTTPTAPPTLIIAATDSPAPEPTPTPTFTFTPTVTLTPTATFTPTLLSETLTPTSGLPLGMQVIVISNPPRGKAPLTVKLDARDSFVRAPDGTLFECRKGACKYIWQVTFGGKPFIESRETRGTLELNLEKRGNYFVSVYICHGADTPTCASGGTVVIVE